MTPEQFEWLIQFLILFGLFIAFALGYNTGDKRD